MGRREWQDIDSIDGIDGTDSSENKGHEGKGKVRLLVEQVDSSSSHSCLVLTSSAGNINTATLTPLMTTTTATKPLNTEPLIAPPYCKS